MELREYGSVLRRWWWLLVLLPLLAGVFTFLSHEEPEVEYGYELEYSVSFMPLPPQSTDQDPRLNAVQASEYVADDLTAILRGSRFASFVQQYVDGDQPVGVVVDASRVTKQHRILTINLVAGSSQEAVEIARAVTLAVEQDLQALLDDLFGTGELRMELINDSGPYVVASGLQSQLNLPLRMILAALAAVVLAFALDYLDDSIRSRDEAERLVGRVLAEIPK